MESKSPSIRRKYSNVNRQNVLIEKKYESEIRRFEKETAEMLSNHLHNTIELLDTIKKVKRNSGQVDSDVKEVSCFVGFVFFNTDIFCNFSRRGFKFKGFQVEEANLANLSTLFSPTKIKNTLVIF